MKKTTFILAAICLLFAACQQQNVIPDPNITALNASPADLQIWQTADDSTLAGLKDNELIEFKGACGIVKVADTAEVNKLIAQAYADSTLSDEIHYVWMLLPNSGDTNTCELIFLSGNEPLMDGTHVFHADPVFDSETGNHVNLVFDEEGSKLFEQISDEHTGGQLAFVLKDFGLTAPFVQCKIPGGQIEITSQFSKETVQAIADIFKKK